MKRNGGHVSTLATVLLGLVFGLVLGAGLGAGLLRMISGEPRAFETPPVATEYAIEAVVEEAYINRILVDSANSMSGYALLANGHIDLVADGIGNYRVELQLGPLRPVVEGRVGFRPTHDGDSIELVLLDARMGRLQLVSVLPSAILDRANASIDQLIVDRLGAHGLKVIGLQSGEDTLRLQFGRQ